MQLSGMLDYPRSVGESEPAGSDKQTVARFSAQPRERKFNVSCEVTSSDRRAIPSVSAALRISCHLCSSPASPEARITATRGEAGMVSLRNCSCFAFTSNDIEHKTQLPSAPGSLGFFTDAGGEVHSERTARLDR